jgi:hypothetical protein
MVQALRSAVVVVRGCRRTGLSSLLSYVRLLPPPEVIDRTRAPVTTGHDDRTRAPVTAVPLSA